MRRIGIILLTFCILTVCCFVGCTPQEENPQSSATVAPTATPTIAPTVKPTVVPTATPTVTPEPTDDGTPKAEDDVYTISLDMSVINGSAGFIFNGLGSEFLMWQLNCGEIEENVLYFRPHIWSGGGSCIEDVLVEETVATGTPGEVVHMEIRMNNGTCETYLNGTLVYTYEAEFYEYDDYCGIGFRQDVIGGNETNFETATFDNIVVKNSLGEIIMQEDFEGDTNFFSEIIEDNEYDCQVQDGKLVVGQTQKVLLIEYLPPLNP